MSTPPPNPPPRGIREGGFRFCRVAFEGEFGTQDWLNIQRLSRLLKADRAIDIIVIGQRQPAHAEVGRLCGKRLRRRGAAQQAVSGVRTQFDVVGGVGHGLFTTAARRQRKGLSRSHKITSLLLARARGFVKKEAQRHLERELGFYENFIDNLIDKAKYFFLIKRFFQ